MLDPARLLRLRVVVGLPRVRIAHEKFVSFKAGRRRMKMTLALFFSLPTSTSSLEAGNL